MCEPTTIMMATSLALSAAGGIAQANASRQAAKSVNSAQEQNARDRMATTAAQRDARTAELERQDGMQRTQSQLLGDTIAGQGQPARDEAIADATQAREAVYDKAGVGVSPMLASATGTGGGANAPTVVDDGGAGNLAAALTRAGEFIKQQRAAKAALEGWGGATFGKGIELARGGEGINFLSNARQGSNRAYGAEQQAIGAGQGYADDAMAAKVQAAPNQGAGMRLFGNVATGLGQVAAGAAGAGYGDKIAEWMKPAPIPGMNGMPAWPGV